MEPWTQRFRVQWPTTLAFYERRYEILRGLETQGKLRSFRNEENSVSARLGDAAHLVSFGADYLRAAILRPDGDSERVLEATATILEGLAPSRFSNVEGVLQFLSPIDRDYDTGRKESVSRILGLGTEVAKIGDTELFDYALLIDGRHSAGTYRIETGVVQATEEVPMRLARGAGRIGSRDPETPPSIWPVDSLPAVAQFADVEWFVEEAPEPTGDALTRAWTDARDAAGAVIEELFRQSATG